MMSSIIARPYAKAAFEFALQAKQLKEWMQWFKQTQVLTQRADVRQFLKNPEISEATHYQFFIKMLALEPKSAESKSAFDNFLQVLAQAHRLIVLPEIEMQFAKLVAEYEKQVDVHLTSAYELSEQEINELKQKLENRLHRKVIVHTTVRQEILGGVIIRADDLVIDGSGLGRLAKLKERLKGNFLCN